MALQISPEALYCVKCKQKTGSTDIIEMVTKNNRKMLKTYAAFVVERSQRLLRKWKAVTLTFML